MKIRISRLALCVVLMAGCAATAQALTLDVGVETLTVTFTTTGGAEINFGSHWSLAFAFNFADEPYSLTTAAGDTWSVDPSAGFTEGITLVDGYAVKQVRAVPERNSSLAILSFGLAALVGIRCGGRKESTRSQAIATKTMPTSKSTRSGVRALPRSRTLAVRSINAAEGAALP
jgi:hypothetical protein